MAFVSFCILDTDTDFSESEALSSLQISGAKHDSGEKTNPFAGLFSNYFNEDHFHKLSFLSEISEPQVHRIETKQAPVPSQPEVVLSDGKFVIEKRNLGQMLNRFLGLALEVKNLS